MIVARLRVSYDRGCERNQADDLGLEAEPETTAEGGIVRGLGSHWRSEEAKQRAADCAAEERRIRQVFKRSFVLAPLPGLFVVPDRRAAQALLDTLEITPDLTVSISVYDLSPAEALPPEEVREWVERIDEQLKKAPLGRGLAADAAGLDTLDRLAACPVLGEETRQALQELVAQARVEAIDRPELKRRLEVLPLEIQLGPECPPARVLPSSSDEMDLGLPSDRELSLQWARPTGWVGDPS